MRFNKTMVCAWMIGYYVILSPLIFMRSSSLLIALFFAVVGVSGAILVGLEK